MSQGGLTVAVDARSLSTVESIASECSPERLALLSPLQRTFQLAAAINTLRRAVTPQMVNELMSLQGSSLGFKTDRDKDGGYHEDVVKECAIEATLRGANWVGNEMNIIAGRVYLTKEFFTRKVREFPGLTDLKLMPGVPRMFEEGALCPYSATWLLNGKPDRIDRKLIKLTDGSELDERIPVKVNKGMGADAVLGKAERKILAAIYKQLTGSEVSDGDVDDVVPQLRTKPVQSIDALTEQLAAKQPEPLPPFDLGAVKDRFDACRSFGDVSKLMSEIRSTIPPEHKDAVSALDEKARDRVRAEIAAAKKGAS